MSILHNDLLNALRDAGDEGLGEGEMAALGGRWWLQRVNEINRRKDSTIGEQNDRYYLVCGPDVEDGRGGRFVAADPAAVLSIEPLTLFPAGRAHYDDLGEAA
jgi:hypothetical protein